ncbi:MAG: hypothetical protein K2K49_00350 [Duncaniella sp.]|nr:hypothetical protein [Duncaniella sp.]
MRHPRQLIPLITAALLLGSCSGEDGVDGMVEVPLTDMATFEGNTAAGGGALFTVRMMDDSPEALLSADVALSEGTAVPQRMIIRYIPATGKPYTTSAIRLTGVSHVNQEPPVIDPTEATELLGLFGADPVETVSVWRTGTYVNIHMRVQQCHDPRTLSLVLVPATVGTASPEYRLVHALPAGTPPSYMRTAYASYDISDVWTLPGVSEVRITMNPGETYTFRRH